VRYIAVHIFVGGRLQWEHMVQFGQHEPLGLTITFPMYRQISQLKAQRNLSEVLKQNDVSWLQPTTSGQWLFRCDGFKAAFPDYKNETWLNGDILIPMDHEVRREKRFEKEEDRTYCRFIITPETVEDQMPKKVFLSHKSGADKAMVRRYKKALHAIGVTGWLDEDAMPAGTELEWGLLAGFKESCAAVLFITPRYRDEGYLATEINYAIAEKRKKGDRFSIITLVIGDADGRAGEVPELLQPYVWKTPATELEGFSELMRALPIATGLIHWKT